MFTALAQPTIAFAEAHLSAPADVLDVSRQMLLSRLNGLGDLGRVAIGLGGLDEGAAGMRVAALRNPAEPTTVAGGVLAGREPEVSHELARLVEAREIAELGDRGDGDDELHAAQRLQRLDDRVQAPALRVPEQFGLEALQLLGALIGGAHIFLEHDLLSRRRDHELGEPAQVSGVPVGAPGIAGTYTGERSPERARRASLSASRLSVLTRSPDFFGVSDGATTQQGSFFRLR